MGAALSALILIPIVLVIVYLIGLNRKATGDSGKIIATLIRVGDRPGLYIKGKRVDDLQSGENLKTKYEIHNFWNSPESEYYDEAFFARVGKGFEDALLDVPEKERAGYLTTLVWADKYASRS